MELVNLILNKKEQFIEFSKLVDNKGRFIKTDTEKEINKLTKRNTELDNYIQLLFEKSATGIIPTSTFEMMMDKYKKEKDIVEQEIKELTRRQSKELTAQSNEEKANFFINQLKEINENNVLSTRIIQRVIKKIYVRSRSINGSNRNKDYEISILFANCDDLIKEFKTYEEHSSNLC